MIDTCCGIKSCILLKKWSIDVREVEGCCFLRDQEGNEFLVHIFICLDT